MRGMKLYTIGITAATGATSVTRCIAGCSTKKARNSLLAKSRESLNGP